MNILLDIAAFFTTLLGVVALVATFQYHPAAGDPMNIVLFYVMLLLSSLYMFSAGYASLKLRGRIR